MRIAGSAYPVYIDGIRYTSMFQASIDSEISYKTLYFRIRDNDGHPVVVKDMTLFSEEWVKQNPREAIELIDKLLEKKSEKGDLK